MAVEQERQVLSDEEFGRFVLDRIDKVVALQFPDFERGTVFIALPFQFTISPEGGKCVCHWECHKEPDGGTTCIQVCKGTGCA